MHLPVCVFVLFHQLCFPLFFIEQNARVCGRAILTQVFDSAQLIIIDVDFVVCLLFFWPNSGCQRILEMKEDARRQKKRCNGVLDAQAKGWQNNLLSLVLHVLKH